VSASNSALSAAPAAGAAPAAARAAVPVSETCPNPVRPGRSIGPVRLGMTLDEVRKLGKVTDPQEVVPGQPAWHTLSRDDGVWRFALGLDRRIAVIQVRGSKVCLKHGGERVIDMHGPTAQNRSPMVGCSLEAAAHRSAWNCALHGVELVWDRRGPSVLVKNPAGGEVSAEPAPAPPWFAPMPGCAAMRHPKLACAFFGGNATLECYPTEPCMGTFSKESPEHATLYTADGDRLGTLKLARHGWSLAYRFARPVAKGSRFRVILDRRVGAPMGHTAQEQRVTRRPIIAVLGATELNDGFVLDLEAPDPAEDMSSKCPYQVDFQCFQSSKQACAARACKEGRCVVVRGDPAEAVCRKE
jgi:hypothetical protein